MRRLLFSLAGWIGAALLVAWRLTLRIRTVDDPRPALRETGRPYVYAILHAQQMSFILFSDDRPVAAMVSASKDGDALVPLCRVRGVVPVRGSSRKRGKDKGGKKALTELIEHVKTRGPALLAVDGPRGPRNTVHWGITKLAFETDAFIVIAGVFPASRKLLLRSWDRTQLPRPFTTLHGRFGPPIDPRDYAGDAPGLRQRVHDELLALEQEWDPVEAAYAQPLEPAAPREERTEEPAS